MGEVPVKRDDWLCEPTIWVLWSCRGAAQALRETNMIAIDSAHFVDAIGKDSNLLVFMQSYAAAYLSYLNDLELDDLTDASRGAEGRSLVSKFIQEVKDGTSKEDDDSEGYLDPYDRGNRPGRPRSLKDIQRKPYRKG